jgi:hypothetical protein
MGFVEDDFALDTKTSLRATRAGAEEYTIRAEDWNRVVQACYDMKAKILELEAGGGGGGYQGVWTAGTYSAGSLVLRGPFLFGTTASTSADPMDVSNLGSVSDWTLNHNGGGNQSGNVIAFTNSTPNKQGCAYRTVTMSTWNSKRIIADLLVGPASGADGVLFGVHDSASATTGDIGNTAGHYGVFLDIWNNRVSTILNGTAGNHVTLPTTGQRGGSEDLVETSWFFRYYLDMVESGANWILTLYRECFDLNTAASRETPGLIATWTVTKPTFTTCRGFVSGWCGGTAGLHKARNFYVQDKSTTWRMLAAFPSTPTLDPSVF